MFWRKKQPLPDKRLEEMTRRFYAACDNRRFFETEWIKMQREVAHLNRVLAKRNRQIKRLKDLLAAVTPTKE